MKTLLFVILFSLGPRPIELERFVCWEIYEEKPGYTLTMECVSTDWIERVASARL